MIEEVSKTMAIDPETLAFYKLNARSKKTKSALIQFHVLSSGGFSLIANDGELLGKLESLLDVLHEAGPFLPHGLHHMLFEVSQDFATKVKTHQHNLERLMSFTTPDYGHLSYGEPMVEASTNVEAKWVMLQNVVKDIQNMDEQE